MCCSIEEIEFGVPTFIVLVIENRQSLIGMMERTSQNKYNKQLENKWLGEYFQDEMMV